jgi:hypothetical protein
VSQSKGGDKAAKQSWAQRVFGYNKKETPKQTSETIDPKIFVLADQFGQLMRDPVYAELPNATKAKLRQPVEQAIDGKDEGTIRGAIATFKLDLKQAHDDFVKSINERIVADEEKVKTLTSRGSHGAKGAGDLLAVAKTDAKEGRAGAAAAQLDKTEVAIVADVGAHIGLAEARINSLTDWGAPEAGNLDNRVKALRSKNTLAAFETTLRDYDTLMRDVAGAAAVPVQEQKTRGLDELRKGIVAALGSLPDPPPTPPTTGGTPPTPPPKPSGTPPPPPPKPGGTPPTPPPKPGGTPPPIMGRRRPPPPAPTFTKPQLQSRFDTWDKALTEAGKETDAKKKDTALDTLDTEGTKLYADILKTKGGDTKAESEDVYKKALEARYGFTIDTKGRDFTNLDKIYAVLKMVPPEDVAQAELKKLTYYEPGKGGAAFGGATIFMGDYGAAKDDWAYTNPDGSPAPANGFSISALHELGHSIDSRNGIMTANRSKSGCGAWTPESVASVTEVYFTSFRYGPGKNSKISEDQMKSAITAALNGSAPGKPDTVTGTDWGPLQTVLDACANLRADKWPWGAPVPLGGRAYHQSYAESNEWWSYDPGARAGTTVRDYQWRSPVEWFAELYAFTNFKKQKPPAGVDAGVAVFMWKS